MPGERGTLWLGTSGYVYRHWRDDVFYPAGLPAREELTWYAGHFSTVELNNPFYRVPTPATFARWRDATPGDFVFAVKVNRVISHIRRLHDVAKPLADFLEVARVLGAKLGPLLVQLPPYLSVDLARLEHFLALLPDGERWVIEFRHASWQTPEVYARLARRQVALCVPIGGRVTPDLVTTAPFTYLRFHAGRGAGGAFLDEELAAWSAKIRGLLRSGKDVYTYFNNDPGGHAVRDAARLRALLRVER
jgi:uncharacterized protein YecE (DUF72 family)